MQNAALPFFQIINLFSKSVLLNSNKSHLHPIKGFRGVVFKKHPFLGIFRDMVFWVRFFGCGFRGLWVRFSKMLIFWAFLGVQFFRCMVFEAARRPKTVALKTVPQKPYLFKTFDRFTGPLFAPISSCTLQTNFKINKLILKQFYKPDYNGKL